MTARERDALDFASWQFCMVWTGLIGLVVAAICVFLPNLDLWIADLLYTGYRNHFILTVSTIGTTLRDGFQFLFACAAALILFGLGRSLLVADSGTRVAMPVWLFLCCVLVVGPGLLANAVFKDNWGRARPHQTEQFGGNKQFTAAFEFSDQCNRNCSFIGGESSSIFALFFAVAFSVPKRRRAFIATGIGAGTVVGLLRMAQGGHYFSDIAVSAFAMMLIVLTLYWAFFLRKHSARKVLPVNAPQDASAAYPIRVQAHVFAAPSTTQLSSALTTGH